MPELLYGIAPSAQGPWLLRRMASATILNWLFAQERVRGGHGPPPSGATPASVRVLERLRMLDATSSDENSHGVDSLVYRITRWDMDCWLEPPNQRMQSGEDALAAAAQRPRR